MQQYSCMALILLCGQRAVQGRKSLTRSVPDALFAAEELDAVLFNQLPAAHQPAMGSLFLTGLHLFLARDAQVAASVLKMRHLLLDLLASLSLVMQLFF